MTIFRTHYMQGFNPFERVLKTVREEIASGKTPNKPSQEEKLAA